MDPLKSNKLYLWPYINAFISLFWRQINLIQTNIYLIQRYFVSNKFYFIQTNHFFESKKVVQTNYFLWINQIFFLSAGIILCHIITNNFVWISFWIKFKNFESLVFTHSFFISEDTVNNKKVPLKKMLLCFWFKLTINIIKFPEQKKNQYIYNSLS